MPARIRVAIASLVVCLAVAMPEIARACAVCGAGRDDETRNAFLLTTLFLSVLPLAMFGGLLLWMRHRLRQRSDGGREPLAPPAAPHA